MHSKWIFSLVHVATYTISISECCLLKLIVALYGAILVSSTLLSS